MYSYIVRVCFFEDDKAKAENCSQDQFGTIIRQNVIKINHQKSLKDMPLYSCQ